MEQKPGMKFKHSAHIALAMARASFVRLIVTVILLAMCGSAVGMCLTTLIPDYSARQEKIFSANSSRYVGFAGYDWSNQPLGDRTSLFLQSSVIGSVNVTSLATLSAEETSRIEQETGLSFAYIYRGAEGTQQRDWFYSDFDRYEEARLFNEALERGETDYSYAFEYAQTYHADEAGERHYLNSVEQPEASAGYGYATVSDAKAFGFTMLAGRLPEAVDEIAIPECKLYEFMRRGYYLYEDVEREEIIQWKQNFPYSVSYDLNLPDGYITNLDEIPQKDPAKIVHVDSAEDIVGKKFMLPAPVMKDGEWTELFTITGVVDTGCDYDYYEKVNMTLETRQEGYTYLQDKIFFSPAAMGQMGREPSCMLALRPTDGAHIQKCLHILQETLDEARSLHDENIRLPYAVMIAGEDVLASQIENKTNVFPQLQLLFGCAGGIFGIFGVLLTYFLMSYSAEKERKPIGILKSLGARDKDIEFIFLLMALAIGLAVFVLAVAGTLGIVYGLMGGIAIGGVPMLEFGALQVTLLFIFCVCIPIATMEFPVRKFLKQTCINMIRERDAKEEVSRV